MTSQLSVKLLPIQDTIFQEVVTNLVTDYAPTILWAGIRGGKTTIAAAVSQALNVMPQVVVGRAPEDFIGFYPEAYYLHPAEITPATKSKWAAITQRSLVFIDNCFEREQDEELFDRVSAITPHVLALVRGDGSTWPVAKYLPNIIGPYASHELNPLIDMTLARQQRPSDKKDISKFNKATSSSISRTTWAEWVRK